MIKAVTREELYDYRGFVVNVQSIFYIITKILFVDQLQTILSVPNVEKGFMHD